MKKKLTLLIAVCLLVFGLAACGEDPRTVDYNGYTYDELQEACQSTVRTLESLSAAELQSYLASGSESTAALVSSWIDNRADLGNFVGFGDFQVEKAGKTLTATQTVNYEARPLTLTYVFNYNNMEVTDINVDQVYTTAEKMGKAGLNTIMCISIVFVVLITISLVIYAFNLIPKIQAAFSKKEEDKPAGDTFVEQIERRETQQDSGELIAVIAAAIAASTGTSTDDFVVRSIRRR